MGKKTKQLNIRLDDETYASFEDWRAGRRPIPMPTSAARTLLRRGASVDLHLAQILSEALPDLIRRGALSAATPPEFYPRLSAMIRDALDAAMESETVQEGKTISLAVRRDQRSS